DTADSQKLLNRERAGRRRDDNGVESDIAEQAEGCVVGFLGKGEDNADLFFQECLSHSRLDVENDEIRSGLAQGRDFLPARLLELRAEDRFCGFICLALKLAYVSGFDDGGVGTLVYGIPSLVWWHACETEHGGRRSAGGGRSEAEARWFVARGLAD